MSKERVTRSQRLLVQTNASMIDMEYRKRKDRENRKKAPRSLSLEALKEKMRQDGYLPSDGASQ